MPPSKINKLWLQFLFFALAIFLLPTVANAQTETEQNCYAAVQGKVAYDQAGHKSWNPDNIKRLCQGTTNPSATISCFESQIRQHNDWSRGIEACKDNAQPQKFIINPTPAKIPAPTNTSPNTGGLNKDFSIITKGANNETIPPGCREYSIEVRTGIQDNAAANGDIFITIHGTTGQTGEINISEYKFERNNNAPGSCQSANLPVQYVRFDKDKKNMGKPGEVIRRKTYERNTIDFVTVNANDVGKITAVGVRTDKSRYYLSYLNIMSNGDNGSHTFAIEKWFSANNISEIFREASGKNYADYTFKINTGDVSLAGTDANVYLTVEGVGGRQIPEFNLKTYISGNPMERGNTDEFTIKNLPVLDPVAKITVRSDSSGLDADWFLNWIDIKIGDHRISEQFTYANWITKDNKSVTLNNILTSRDGRTITFRNEVGFVAKMSVQYFVMEDVGGQKMMMPKSVETANMPVGQSSSIPIPMANIAPNSKIMVFLIGSGTTRDGFYFTQLDFNFTGDQCFKAYNTFDNPKGASCN